MAPDFPLRQSTTRFRTIVADPPWHYERTGVTLLGDTVQDRGMPYESMSVEHLMALPISDYAMPDTRPERLGSHLYLWTTTAYIEAAYAIARAWSFQPSCLLVWCKPPRAAGMGGHFQSNVEFVLFAKRGAPKGKATTPTRWFTWPRGAHSEKPDAFYDLVEQVSHGPYLELFARRARFGWEYAGDGSLSTVEIPGLRAPGQLQEAA